MRIKHPNNLVFLKRNTFFKDINPQKKKGKKDCILSFFSILINTEKKCEQNSCIHIIFLVKKYIYMKKKLWLSKWYNTIYRGLCMKREKKVRKKVEKKGGKKRQEGGVVWESLRNN